MGRMTVGELRAKYREVFGEESRSNHKQFLFRRIAWRVQALAEGGLSERARRRALEIASDADLRIRAPAGRAARASPCRPRPSKRRFSKASGGWGPTRRWQPRPSARHKRSLLVGSRRPSLNWREQLRQLNTELAQLAGDGTERLDRFLSLQKQIQATEQRLAELAAELQELRNDAFDEQDLVPALQQFDPVWNSLTTREQARLVQLLIEQVGYDGRSGKVTVSLRSAGLKELCNGKGDTKTQIR